MKNQEKNKSVAKKQEEVGEVKRLRGDLVSVAGRGDSQDEVIRQFLTER